MGSASKRKGSAGERELLGILQEHGDAHRNEQRYIGGSGNPDISFSCGCHRFHVEAKRVERLNLHAAIQQAERDAVEGRTPIVMHRRNREPWYRRKSEGHPRDQASNSIFDMYWCTSEQRHSSTVTPRPHRRIHRPLRKLRAFCYAVQAPRPPWRLFCTLLWGNSGKEVNRIGCNSADRH